MFKQHYNSLALMRCFERYNKVKLRFFLVLGGLDRQHGTRPPCGGRPGSRWAGADGRVGVYEGLGPPTLRLPAVVQVGASGGVPPPEAPPLNFGQVVFLAFAAPERSHFPLGACSYLVCS